MMRKTLPAILVTLALVASAAADPGELYLPPDPLKGAVRFAAEGCDRCHSIEGQGGSFGPDLARSDLDRSLLDVLALMWNHSPHMSELMRDLRVKRSRFTSTELAELAAYIYYLSYFDKPGDIARGREVFTAKACSKCHRVGGVGRNVGPDLSPIKRFVSPIFLAQIMWNHGPEIKARMDELGVEWPEFDGAEMSNLMAFLRDASRSDDPERIFMRPGDPQIGKQLFERKKCITCHEVLGSGTAIGPDLLESSFHTSVTSIASIMWNHGPSIWEKMRELDLESPTFDDNEMADLTAFLYFLRFSESEGDATRGEMLFRQKGCRDCHHFGTAEVEDSFSLSAVAGEEPTGLDVAAEMWNDAERMEEMMARRRLEWPRLAKGELNDLIAYILSHRKP